MRYYLSGWGLDAAGDFTPTGTEDMIGWSCIDFRPDSTVADGFCLVAVPDDITLAGGTQIAGGKTERLSAARKRAWANRVGLNLGGQSFDELALELLTVHATPDGDKTRWNRVRPTIANRTEIWLGGEKIVDIPAVSGGATYTDDFNTADTTTFGADLTWTEIGSLEIYSNEAAATTSGTAIQRARAEHDCATSNNYAQVTLTLHINLSTDFFLAACRYDSATTTAYEATQGNGSATTGTVLRKVVTGTTTSLSTGTNSWALNDVLRSQATGSTISHKINGTTHLSVTDTSITTGTRGGLGIKSFSPTTLRIDNFEVGDLPVSATRRNDRLVAAIRRTSYW